MPKIIRCPYCVERGKFMPMTEHSSGEWLLCERCGHLALPKNPMFRCTCSHCVRIEKAQNSEDRACAPCAVRKVSDMLVLPRIHTDQYLSFAPPPCFGRHSVRSWSLVSVPPKNYYSGNGWRAYVAGAERLA